MTTTKAAVSMLYIIGLLIALTVRAITYEQAFPFLLGWCLVDYVNVIVRHIASAK